MNYPVGRSGYDPRRARVGAPNPQRDPHLFSVEDLQAEIRYLERIDRSQGKHPLRALARTKIWNEINRRRIEERS